MIAGDDRRQQAGEDARPIVHEGRGFAVRTARPDDRAAMHRADTLMTQAHAKNGSGPAETANDVGRDPGFSGGARPWRNDDVRWREPLDVFDRHLVIAMNHG